MLSQLEFSHSGFCGVESRTVPPVRHSHTMLAGGSMRGPVLIFSGRPQTNPGSKPDSTGIHPAYVTFESFSNLNQTSKDQRSTLQPMKGTIVQSQVWTTSVYTSAGKFLSKLHNFVPPRPSAANNSTIRPISRNIIGVVFTHFPIRGAISP